MATNLCLALLILYSAPYLSLGSGLESRNKFCMNSRDCFYLVAFVTRKEGKVLLHPVSWDDAFTKCRSLGLRLAVVNNQHVQEEIENHFTTANHKFFNADGNQHAWVAGRKDDKWRWVDGKEHHGSAKRFNRTGEDGQRCAVAAANAGLHAYNCVKDVSNYICVFKNKDCPGDPTHEGWTRSMCIGTYREERNWFDARRACLEKGGDLFSPDNGYSGYIMASNTEAWVGLQRDLWQWIVPRDGYQANETTPMQYWNWAEGESSDGGERCVYMDLQTRTKWRDKPCDYSNYFICENLLPETATPTASPRTVSQTTTTNNQMLSNGNPDTLSSTSAPSEGMSSSSTTWIAVIAVLAAFVVVIVVVGLVLKIRSMGSRVEILQKEMTHLRRSERGTLPVTSQSENSTNPLPAICPLSEFTYSNGLYTGRGPRDPPSTTPSVYSSPYAEVGNVSPYTNLPVGVIRATDDISINQIDSV